MLWRSYQLPCKRCAFGNCGLIWEVRHEAHSVISKLTESQHYVLYKMQVIPQNRMRKYGSVVLIWIDYRGVHTHIPDFPAMRNPVSSREPITGRPGRPPLQDLHMLGRQQYCSHHNTRWNPDYKWIPRRGIHEPEA